MRKQVFDFIGEQLRLIADDEGNAVIKQIGLWNKSITDGSNTELSAPSVFVEFDTISWSMLGAHIREADLTVKLHVITEALNSNGQAFDIIDKIYCTLTGSKAENIGAFTPLKSEVDSEYKKGIHWIESYITHITDNSAQVTLQTIGSQNVKIELNKE